MSEEVQNAQPLIVTDHSLSGIVTNATTGVEVCVSLEGERMSREEAKKVLIRNHWMYLIGIAVAMSCLIFFSYFMFAAIIGFPSVLGYMKTRKLCKVVGIKINLK